MSKEHISSDGEKTCPTQFMSETFALVEDPTTDEVVSWNEDGTSFIIWNPTEFVEDLLPKFFKHNKLSKFFRQLHNYGFLKIAPDRLEFANRFFRRGQLGVLCDIQRGKLSTVSTSRVASPPNVVNLVTPEGSPSNEPQTNYLSSLSDLIDENDKLKKEIENLNKKLDDMNVLFINMFNLMWRHTDDDNNNKEGRIKKETAATNPLSDSHVGESSGNIPMEVDGELSPKLFGVNVSGKRYRMDNDETSEPHNELGGAHNPSDNMKRF